LSLSTSAAFAESKCADRGPIQCSSIWDWRRAAVWQHPPILVLSGRTLESQEDRSLAARADDYVTPRASPALSRQVRPDTESVVPLET
jgi:hypothetical protein